MKNLQMIFLIYNECTWLCIKYKLQVMRRNVIKFYLAIHVWQKKTQIAILYINVNILREKRHLLIKWNVALLHLWNCTFITVFSCNDTISFDIEERKSHFFLSGPCIVAFLLLISQHNVRGVQFITQRYSFIRTRLKSRHASLWWRRQWRWWHRRSLWIEMRLLRQLYDFWMIFIECIVAGSKILK